MYFGYKLFLSLFLFRYLRLVVSIFAFYSLRPVPIPENPRFTSKDVTVIIPSLEGDGQELFETIQSILATEPHEIILVTVDANLERARTMIKNMGTPKIRVLAVPHPNKRRQMVRAIPEVRTSITVFADDDVTWPSTLLPWILAPFEDERYGGVGTNQRLRRADGPTALQRMHGYLGALYLERRNFDCASCVYMDGGLPCLSGRTVAYRTTIINEGSFIYGFTHEEWMGKYQLNADDDNFLTRWLVSHGWKIGYQYHKEAEVLTTLEDNPKYWKQCLRWVRSNWRSNTTSLFREQIWRLQPWSTYAVFQTTLTHWSLLWDCLLMYTFFWSTATWAYTWREVGFFVLTAWMFVFSKFIKSLGHYIRHPVDFLLLPISILFGYLHGLIKLHGLLSINVTTWGSRDGADDDHASYRMVRVDEKHVAIERPTTIYA